MKITFVIFLSFEALLVSSSIWKLFLKKKVINKWNENFAILQSMRIIAIKSIKTRVAIYTYRFSSGNFDPYCISFLHNVLGLNYKVTFRCIWDTSWSYLTFVLIAASVVFDTHLEPAQGMEQMIWLFIKLLCNNDHTMCATSQMQDIIKMCFRCYNVCWTLPLIGS